MVKKILVVVALFLVTTPAFSEMITFDPFPSIPLDVTVQYFDNGLTGVLGSLPTPNAVALRDTNSAIPSGGKALRLYDDDPPVFGPYGALFTFASLQSVVSMVGNDFGGDPDDDNEIVHLSAFDSIGTFIGSSTFTSDFAEPNIKPISFSAVTANIKYIAFTWENDRGYYLLDNVQYGAVPEPATMLLLGFGLAGLVAFRKKI